MNFVRRALEVLFFPKKRKKYSNTNIIVFGEWYGKKCCDNCLYLANYIVKNNDTKFDLYWILDKECDDTRLDIRVKRLIRDSSDAESVLNRARFIFVNQGIVDVSSNPYFVPLNSCLINLWHGIAWKRIGADLFYKNPFKAYYSRKVYIKDGTDYYLSTSAEFSKKLHSSFGVKYKNIIYAGYPRNSIFYDSIFIDKLRKSFCLKHKIDEKSIIVSYLPTFRNNTNSKSLDFLFDNKEFLSFAQENNVFIIQKNHFVVEQKSLYSEKTNKRIINDNDLSASEILSLSNILITDYSSCFFDFLILNKPIIHYIYDYDYYAKDDKGLYYNVDDVCCGKVCYKDNDLSNAIMSYVKNPIMDEELRLKRREKFMEYEDDQACKKIFERILNIK